MRTGEAAPAADGATLRATHTNSIAQAEGAQSSDPGPHNAIPGMMARSSSLDDTELNTTFLIRAPIEENICMLCSTVMSMASAHFALMVGGTANRIVVQSN